MPHLLSIDKQITIVLHLLYFIEFYESKYMLVFLSHLSPHKQFHHMHLQTIHNNSPHSLYSTQ